MERRRVVAYKPIVLAARDCQYLEGILLYIRKAKSVSILFHQAVAYKLEKGED